MRIGLCDDDKYWLERAEQILKKYAMHQNVSIELASFMNIDKMELCMDENEFDMVFLDIEMEGERTGIDFARRINRKFPACKIVYLTNHIDYAVDVYETEHEYFVLKEQFERRLGDIFRKVELHKKRMCRQIGFQVSKTVTKMVYEHEISYIERKLRNTIIHTDSEEIIVKNPLDNLPEEVKDVQFARSHNSFIVYFPAVKEIQRDKIIMKDEAIIPISRRYKDNVKERFAEWIQMQNL